MTRPRLSPSLLALALAACAAPARQIPAVEASYASPPAPPLGPPEADRSKVPPAGPPPALRLPPQQRFRLSNGLRVRLVAYHRLPIVALHLVLDAGALHDPGGKPGLASFTAAMLTEGTARRSSTQVSDALADVGAVLHATAGHDQAALSGAALARHLDALLDVFADVLSSPAFLPADFARVQDQLIVALVQERDVPAALAAKVFARLRWGDHPYGRWSAGTEASLASISREDLARFHAERWRPEGAELVVVGDVSGDALLPLLEKALAGWRGAPAPARSPAPAPEPLPRTLLVPKRDAPQAYLVMGMPGFARGHADQAPADVLFQVLGGGTSSRLFRNLREKEGYTYGTSARGESRRFGGTGLVAGSLRSDAAGRALQALLAEIAALRDEPVQEEELRVARNGLVLSLPSDFATAGGIAAKLAEESVYALPDDYWERYADEVMRVGPAEVQRAARTWLDPSRLTTVMVCSPDAVKPQLAGLPLGPIEVQEEEADGAR